MSAKYSALSRAQLSFEYLHTNSTTHEFLFGALAELLDNSRDAAATKINIFTVKREDLRGNCMICFLDDGDGMEPDEIASVMKFGSSCKKSGESNMIGQYGNGLKSGSMRIGKDFVLFTKKESTMSCLCLSRTFHESEALNEVIVPMPSWNRQTRLPLSSTDEERAKHSLELDIILKYSPFGTKKQLMEQFDKIDSDTGTLVVCYNLKTLDNGEPEIDIDSDPTDILLTTMDYEKEYEDEREHFVIPEKKSFRAYTAVLYQEPRMRIYIQHSKVRTKRLETMLYLPKQYEYSSARFKARSEKETHEAENRCKLAEERAREAESDARSMEKRLGDGGTKEERMELRTTQQHAIECRRDTEVLRKLAERKRKALKEPKTLKFTFGLNITNRKCFGMFVYNCSRLIKMYERVGPQLEGGSSGVGVVGVVNVPYLVLEPTHNKQDFADAKEYRHLLRALGEYLHHYWQICGVVDPRTGSGVRNFWAEFGYFTNKWTEEPSIETKYAKKRVMKTQQWQQCDRCLKWRLLPFSSTNFNKSDSISDEWTCHQNPDVNYNKCMVSEQQVKITLENINRKPVEESPKPVKKAIESRKEDERVRRKSGEPHKKKHSEPIIVTRTPKSVEKERLVSKSGPNHAKANPFQSFTDNLKVNSQKKKLPHKSSHKNREDVREKYPARERPERKTREASSEEEEESEEGEEEEENHKTKTNGSRKRSLSPTRSPSHKDKRQLRDEERTSIITVTQESEEQTKEIAQLKKTQEKLAESLRLSLHYFSPPSWPTKKEDLIGLGLDQLLEFPLNKFFDTYEVNLTELIAQYQQQATESEDKTTALEAKLTNLRKLVMQLLRRPLNLDSETNSEDISDNVDEILEAVVRESSEMNT